MARRSTRGASVQLSVSQQAEFDLRERLFAHLLRLDALFYRQARTGD